MMVDMFGKGKKAGKCTEKKSSQGGKGGTRNWFCEKRESKTGKVACK